MPGNERGRAFLDDLLMTALHGAFALTEMNQVAVPVARDLDFNVTRLLDHLFEVDFAVVKSAFRFAGCFANGRFEFASESTRRIPLPPPPAAALSSTG